MELDYLELEFENCESVTIPGHYIGIFDVDDIRTSYRRVACNSINRIDTANKVTIEIHRDADHNSKFFPDFHDEERMSLFKRIQSWNDITHIAFRFKEDETEHNEPIRFTVFWNDTNNECNFAQKSYLSDLGHMYIVIGDNISLEDVFDFKTINDWRTMNFHMEAMKIGDKNNTEEDEEW